MARTKERWEQRVERRSAAGVHGGSGEALLVDISPAQVVRQFGLGAVTFSPRVPGGRLHAPTAGFLSAVGLPESKFFSPRLDLESERRLGIDHGPRVKAYFARYGAECPPEAEGWEVIGGFLFALVAIAPENGMIYAFSEGEPDPHLMHGDVSSLVHALMVLERGRAHYRGLDFDDDAGRGAVVARMRREITSVDPTPFVDDEGEWPRLFEEIGLGMWG
ncbi:SUKH-4 family immunity protein [Streptomyces sp. NPDC058955]|uniref:SUKH-4 family immunity protein n=1 Tax=unclassified Streptomyces TaxID=2593676 RepID=UPI003657DCB7